MKLLAVNGRKWSKEVTVDALREAKGGSAPLSRSWREAWVVVHLIASALAS